MVILHLSDLHAGQRFAKSDSGITNRCKRLLDFFNNHTFGTLGLPEVDLLVLSGDLTDAGQPEEFLGLRDEFVRPLIKGGLCRSAIAVPGNHDVDWKLVRNPLPPRTPLSEFNTHFLIAYDELQGHKIFAAPTAPTEGAVVLKVTGAEWCQIVPFNSVNLGGTPHPDIARYLLLLDPDQPIKDFKHAFEVNEDMAKKGDLLSKIPPIDPAIVTDHDLTRVRTMLTKETPGDLTPFRIAVIHHNPIPYASEGSNPRPYRFLNDGAFNDFLIKNRFHLVLHGHQHVSELFISRRCRPHPHLASGA